MIVVVKHLIIFFFKSKHSFLAEFANDLNKFNKIKAQKRKTRKEKKNFLFL